MHQAEAAKTVDVPHVCNDQASWRGDTLHRQHNVKPTSVLHRLQRAHTLTQMHHMQLLPNAT